MTNLQARLDRIRDRITSEEFLHGRGLGNDVPFYAFDYPSVSEQQVNNHIEWLLEDLARKTGLKIGVVNMFELAVEQLKKRDLYAKALAMEKAKGVSSLGSVAKIVKLEHAWRRLDGRNDDGFQVAPFPG
jgi:hypothetical protein